MRGGEHVVRFNLIEMFEDGDLHRWDRLDRFLCGRYEMSGGKRVGREVTHRSQKQKENKKQFESKNH